MGYNESISPERLGALNEILEMGMTDEEITLVTEQIVLSSELAKILLEAGHDDRQTHINIDYRYVLKTDKPVAEPLVDTSGEDGVIGVDLPPEVEYTLLRNAERSYYHTAEMGPRIVIDSGLGEGQSFVEGTELLRHHRVTFRAVRYTDVTFYFRTIGDIIKLRNSVDKFKNLVKTPYYKENRSKFPEIFEDEKGLENVVEEWKNSALLNFTKNKILYANASDDPPNESTWATTEEVLSLLQGIKLMIPEIKVPKEAVFEKRMNSLKATVVEDFDNTKLLARYVYIQQLKNNNRLVVIAGKQEFISGSGYYRNGVVRFPVGILLLAPDFQPFYDYADIDSYLIADFNYSLTGRGSLINLINPVAQDVKIMKADIERKVPIFFEKLKKGEVLTQDVVDAADRKIARQDSMQNKKEDMYKKKHAKVKEKVEGLSQNTHITVNDVEIYSNKVVYLKQVLRSDIFDFKKYIRRHYTENIETVNYDILFEAFLDAVAEYITEDYVSQGSGEHSTIAHIGDLSVTVSKKYGTNEYGNFYNNYYINNIRINKEEVRKMLDRAACFTTMDAYNDVLKRVSACSLRISNYLDRGVVIKLRDPRDYHSFIQIQMELERKSGKNFVKVGKETYKIKNINKLLRMGEDESGSSPPGLFEFLDIAADATIVEGMTNDVVSTIVKEGKHLYEDAVKKSKELLEKVVKQFKLETVTIEINGREQEAYKVQGKLAEYAVVWDREKNTCPVYTYPNMQYKCIVDKTPNQQAGVDNLVNRIFALKNDTLLVNQIHTL